MKTHARPSARVLLPHIQPVTLTPLEPRMLLSGSTEFPIDFTLTQDTGVSLVITDTNGSVIRELLRSEDYEAGSHTVIWDGLDHEGQAVAPGNYNWKILETQGLTAEFKFQIGSNPPWSPYDTWVGDNTSTAGIALDPSGNILFGAPNSEGNRILMKMSADGLTKLGERVQHFDGGTGPSALGYGENGAGEPRVVALMQRFTDAVVRTYNDNGPFNEVGIFNVELNGERPSDMDVAGQEIVLTYPSQGVVRWMNTSGADIATASVPGATSVAMIGSGSAATVLIGTTTGEVVSLSRDLPTPVTEISGLDVIGKMDVDPTNGDVYLYESGAAQQIKRYNSSFALQQTYGTFGGREYGLYVDTDFRNVTELVADGNGGFWISETNTAPGRMTLFDSATGQVQLDSLNRKREHLGGSLFYQSASADPGNPNFIWADNQTDEIIQYSVDWTNETWSVHATYAVIPDGQFIGDGIFSGRAPGSDSATRWNVKTINGETFLAFSNRPELLRVDEANGVLLPASVVTAAQQNGTGTDNYPQPYVDALIAQGFTDISTAPRYFSYADDNSDGVMDTNEFTFYPGPNGRHQLSRAERLTTTLTTSRPRS